MRNKEVLRVIELPVEITQEAPSAPESDAI